ncbi:MAG: hypothetical protein PHV16_04760 [Candidatus Nanoarchaeia archaeon]|nr:hypothetical protein [Candidatus Nanoarchaeia archaeon]
MLSLKVPLKKAEQVKKYLINNSLFDKKRIFEKDDNFIYFPIIEKNNLKEKFDFVDFIDKELREAKKESITDLLSKKLTKEELILVPSAFDVIGDIIILEIKPELEKKEKIVAQAFLKLNKNIKTVAKKSGIHKGVFRTQKLKILAGERKKETLHIENNVRIKLDVEKVYFSPRLSNERKRIMKLVKPNESVLVMFSGCGPYPAVLSKNTNAKEIYGVEVNPTAHKYAVENIKDNKLKNVELFLGDVNDVLPKLGDEMIGLKSRWQKKYLQPKLKQNPGLIEFYMPEKDMESEKTLLKIDKTIKELSKKQIKVMIHMPLVYKNDEMSLAKEKKKLNNAFECIKKLNWLCEGNGNVIGFVFHPLGENFNLENYSEKYFFENLDYLEKQNLLDNLYLENCPGPIFGSNKDILNVIKKSKLKHICFDFAHYLISNKKISVKDYKDISSEIDVYSHVVNHKLNSGKHCCRLKEGDIDFKEFAEHIDKGCIEVYSKSEIEAKEQIDDWKYFLSIKPRKKFDRIVMPLPKSAEDFLELTLKSIKNKGTIHFYDFLNENEFYKAKEKITKACKKAKKKCKILRIVKCGQHAPYVFRICVDFKVS